MKILVVEIYTSSFLLFVDAKFDATGDGIYLGPKPEKKESANPYKKSI